MMDRFCFTRENLLRQYTETYPQASAVLVGQPDLDMPLQAIVQPDAVWLDLAQRCRMPPTPIDAEWAQCGIPELLQHLATGHHRYLFAELGRLQVLVGSLGFPAISERVTVWADDVRLHMVHEEDELFPRCLALAGEPDSVLDEELHGMYRGHEETESGLVAICEELSEISGNLERIATIQALLIDIIGDLHVHVELEDTVLLPAVRFEQDIEQTRRFRKSQVLRALQPKVVLKAADRK